MNIRNSVEEDLPAIIELLKLSLGESLIPKSLELWNWKHVNNPHGVSPVLVAEEGGKIVGVRAFMRWEWLYKGEKIKTLRAVDTATHPEYQGKGIFKKLTLAGVDKAKAAGIDFIYNTPNKSSKPGYIKMGWVEKGKVSLKLKVNPLAYRNFKEPALQIQNWDRLNDILLSFSNPIESFPQVQTKLTNNYIKWRYQANPLFDYKILSDYESFVLIYRIKMHSFGLEMRIVDIFIDSEKFNSTSQKNLRSSFKDIAKSCFLISASGRHYKLVKNVYPRMGILPVFDIGPIVTLRNLSLEQMEFEDLKDSINWGYSLGDMELF